MLPIFSSFVSFTLKPYTQGLRVILPKHQNEVEIAFYEKSTNMFKNKDHHMK
jgi:hypothetical protein